MALAASLRRPRLPDQVPAGLPRPARLRARLRLLGQHDAAPADRRTRRGARHGPRHERLVGRDRRDAPDRQQAVHRRQHDRLAARPDLRLRRPRPDLRRQRPGRRRRRRRRLQRRRSGRSGSSTTRCSARSPGSSRSRSSAWSSGLYRRRWAARTDLALAGYLLWGGWFVVTAIVFSYMSGVIHSYYAVALAPAIAALVGAGLVDLWGARLRIWLGGVAVGLACLGHGLVRVAASRPNAGLRPGRRSGRRSALAARGAAGPGRRLAAAAARQRDGTTDRPRRPRRSASARPCWPRRPTRSTRCRTAYGGGDPHPGPGAAGSLLGGGPGGFGGGSARRRTPRRAPGGGIPGAGGRGGFGGGLATGADDSALLELPRRQPRRRHLDRGRQLVPAGRHDRAGHGPAGHGHGRLHRLGPDADARPAQELHRLGQAALRPGGRRRLRRRRLRRRRLGGGNSDRTVLGDEHLQGRRTYGAASLQRSTIAPEPRAAAAKGGTPCEFS